MKRILLLLILQSFVFIRCVSTTSTPEYAWDIDISNGEYNQPVSEVSFVMNGEEIEVMDRIDAAMENISQTEFKNKGIPDSAILACGGFWAGYEQILYVKEKDAHLEFVLMTFEEGFAEPRTVPIKTIDNAVVN